MMADDEHYRDMLESKRLDIVQNLQVERTYVFDYLRSKAVLDGEDCELIHNEKTTSRKIGKFVDILARKGPDGYNHLLESLQLENPVLYEKLTGKEANATNSPIIEKLKDSYLGVGGPLGNSELEILTKHLERTYGDLHEMTCRFEEVVQRKKSIEERLETTMDDLKRNQEKMEDLKKQIDSGKSSRGNSPTNSIAQVKWLQYMDTLRKEKSDRDIYIIALQTKLMSAKEEIVELQKTNDNLNAKNEQLQKLIDEVQESYKDKKNESLRLSERIQRQGDEMMKVEQTMRKYRECQFQNIKLREEKDQLRKDLDELQKCTRTLKIHFDIVESEKVKTMSHHTAIMADFGNVQNELMEYKDKLNEAESDAAELRGRIRHLEQDRECYMKQRESALRVRREAILDRDKAYLERDQALRKYNEMKANNEANLERSILQLKNYDELVARNDVMEEELQNVKMKMRKTERILEDVKLKCGLEEGQGSDEEIQDDPDTINSEVNIDADDAKPAEEPDEIGENSPSVECHGEYKNPSPTELLLSSIKRRIDKLPAASCLEECPVSPEDIFSLYICPIKCSSEHSFPTAPFPDLLSEPASLHRKKQSRFAIRGRPNSVEWDSDEEHRGKPDNDEAGP